MFFRVPAGKSDKRILVKGKYSVYLKQALRAQGKESCSYMMNLV